MDNGSSISVDKVKKHWAPLRLDLKYAVSPYKAEEQPAAPDYTDLACWIAHPDKKGCPSNTIVPEGESPVLPPGERSSDCFFVQGSPMARLFEFWHVPVPDKVIDEFTTVEAAFSAGAFNSCCRIFAPSYRGTGLPSHNYLHHPDQDIRKGAPEDRWKGAQEAMDAAASDVFRAFDEFLKQTGDRPIVLASHSQGSHLAQRVLERFHEDEKVRKRLVCAYILGPCSTFPMDKFERNFPSLKPCSGPLDTGCVVAFDNCSEDCPALENLADNNRAFSRNKMASPYHIARYVGEDGKGVWESMKDKMMFCTNPITWTSEPGRADASLHLGMISTKVVCADGETEPQPRIKNIPDQGLKIAYFRKCSVGTLWAEIIHDGGVLLQAKDEETCRPHDHDEFECWFFNIRENCNQRVDAFLASKA